MITMHRADYHLFAEGEVGGCSRPPCRIFVWRDPKWRATIYAHGDDGNPEHWLRVADLTIARARRKDFLQRYVRRWLERVHDWERARA